MRVFETTLDIQENGQAILQLPEGLKPGPRHAVIVLEEPAETETETDQSETKPPAPEPLPLPQVPVTGWTATGSTRREDLYGERGR